MFWGIGDLFIPFITLYSQPKQHIFKMATIELDKNDHQKHKNTYALIFTPQQCINVDTFTSIKKYRTHQDSILMSQSKLWTNKA